MQVHPLGQVEKTATRQEAVGDVTYSHLVGACGARQLQQQVGAYRVRVVAVSGPGHEAARLDSLQPVLTEHLAYFIRPCLRTLLLEFCHQAPHAVAPAVLL